MKPSGTPTLMSAHEECLPFKTILCILSLENQLKESTSLQSNHTGTTYK